jgi:hypothetical protein
VSALKILAMILLVSSVGFGAQPLFEKGDEKFAVVDSQSKTPIFRIFKDSATKRTLAMAINTAWNLSDKGPTPYVDVKFQKVLFRPSKTNPEKAAMFLHVSGYEIDLETSVTKSDLKSGKPITVKIPKSTQSFALFNVTSIGELTVKFDTPKNVLLIENATARLDIENPVSSDESEQIKFNGKGIRQ